MPQRDVLTIGNAEQDDNNSTFEISQFCSIEGKAIESIDLNKEENEEKIVHELNISLSQEEKQLLKVKMEIQDIENNINDEVNMKVKDIFSLMDKYMEIIRLNTKNDLTHIENNLIKLHNNKFDELLKKENYNLKSIDDNIEKYEELGNYIEKLQRNIKFVSNTTLNAAIMEEINALTSKNDILEKKLIKLLKCDEESLELTVKSHKLISVINHNNSQEQIDISLIENNFVDYINLGQKKRMKGLIMFMEKNLKKYISIAEVKKDIDVIVSELNKPTYSTDTIEFY